MDTATSTEDLDLGMAEDEDNKSTCKKEPAYTRSRDDLWNILIKSTVAQKGDKPSHEFVHQSLASGSIKMLPGSNRNLEEAVELQDSSSESSEEQIPTPPVVKDNRTSSRKSSLGLGDSVKLDLSSLHEKRPSLNSLDDRQDDKSDISMDSDMLNISVSDFLDKDKKKSNKEGSPGKIETFVMFPIKTCNKYTSTEDLIIAKRKEERVESSKPIETHSDEVMKQESLFEQLKGAENPLLYLFETCKGLLPAKFRAKLLSTAKECSGDRDLRKVMKVFVPVLSELQHLRGQIAGVELELAKSEDLSQSLSVLAGLTEGDIHSYEKSFEDMFRYEER